MPGRVRLAHSGIHDGDAGAARLLDRPKHVLLNFALLILH
jgi:hypothetical protein